MTTTTRRPPWAHPGEPTPTPAEYRAMVNALADPGSGVIASLDDPGMTLSIQAICAEITRLRAELAEVLEFKPRPV